MTTTDTLTRTEDPRQRLNDPTLFVEKNLVGGRWIGADGRTLDVNNPATRRVIGSVPHFGRMEARAAIEAAATAFRSWRKTLAKERASIMRRWFDLIMANCEDVARIMTLEQGKPIRESRGEVTYAASFIEWFAEEAKRAYGEIIPQHVRGRRILVTREPIGVAAAVTPWNFPAAMITRKVAPALAAGCTTVVKPASATPFTALALAVLAERAGVPAGVLNVITGSAREIGEELTTNPTVRKFSFTGSTEIGRALMAQCAGTVKKVSLELGGNAPFLVFDDADLDAAVQGLMASKYRNSGQTCVCANRVYVQAGVYDAFADKMVAAVRKMKVGDGLEEDTDQGPLIDDAAVEKVEEHIADAVAKGAKVRLGGKRHALGGTFFEPTVLTDVGNDTLVAREETFGPVLPLFRFATEEEAIRLANDTEFGLASYFYARDVGRIWRVSDGLEYGMVAVNEGILSTEVAPFGGVKQSGIGREGSRHGLDEYLEMKYVTMGGIEE